MNLGADGEMGQAVSLQAYHQRKCDILVAVQTPGSQGGNMRRLSIEEQIRKDRPVINTVQPPACGVCGADLELDKESGQYLCPTCDADEAR
jgi:hypothetical protein